MDDTAVHEMTALDELRLPAVSPVGAAGGEGGVATVTLADSEEPAALSLSTPYW